MDDKILMGGAVTLAVATIIGVVSLAFKNPDAYMRLSNTPLKNSALDAEEET